MSKPRTRRSTPRPEPADPEKITFAGAIPVRRVAPALSRLLAELDAALLAEDQNPAKIRQAQRPRGARPIRCV